MLAFLFKKRMHKRRNFQVSINTAEQLWARTFSLRNNRLWRGSNQCSSLYQASSLTSWSTRTHEPHALMSVMHQLVFLSAKMSVGVVWQHRQSFAGWYQSINKSVQRHSVQMSSSALAFFSLISSPKASMMLKVRHVSRSTLNHIILSIASS